MPIEQGQSRPHQLAELSFYCNNCVHFQAKPPSCFFLLATQRDFSIGEGPEYMPLGDLRSVPEAGRLTHKNYTAT